MSFDLWLKLLIWSLFAGYTKTKAGWKAIWWTGNVFRNLINHIAVSCFFTLAYSGSIAHLKVMIAKVRRECFFSKINRCLGAQCFLQNLLVTATLLKKKQSNISALIGFGCVDECPWVWNNYNIDRQMLMEMSDVSSHSSLYILCTRWSDLVGIQTDLTSFNWKKKLENC